MSTSVSHERQCNQKSLDKISAVDNITHSKSSFPWVIKYKIRICKTDTLSLVKKKKKVIKYQQFYVV